MTKLHQVPDFQAMFPKVYVKEGAEKRPPVCKIMHRICLIEPTNF